MIRLREKAVGAVETAISIMVWTPSKLNSVQEKNYNFDELDYCVDKYGTLVV